MRSRLGEAWVVPCVLAQYASRWVVVLLVTDSGESLMWGIDSYSQKCSYGLGDKSQGCCVEGDISDIPCLLWGTWSTVPPTVFWRPLAWAVSLLPDGGRRGRKKG